MCNNNECVFPMCISNVYCQEASNQLQFTNTISAFSKIFSISKQFYRWNFIDDNIMHFEIILCAFCRNYGSNGSQALKRNTPLIQRLTSARKKHTIRVLLPYWWDSHYINVVMHGLHQPGLKTGFAVTTRVLPQRCPGGLYILSPTG